MKLEVGQVVEGYRVERPLGAGGTAVVYLVHDVASGTAHALKVLSISSPAIRERMLREGRVQSTLDHANVVAVHDVLELKGAPALLMEFVEGPSLEAALKRYRLTLGDAELLFAGILDGVRAAHAAGLVHRDLKPANVLLARTPDGFVPKVTDFGLAKMMVHEPGAAHTKAGISMGTPSYMAPEQIRDARSVDQRADIWSLGCLLYELTTRQRTFPGDQALAIYNAVVDADYHPPRQHVPELPDRLNQAILGCLQLDPGDRMPDCTTLADVIAGELTWEVEDQLILGRPLMATQELSVELLGPDVPSMPLAARDSIHSSGGSTGSRSSLDSSMPSAMVSAGASLPPSPQLRRRQVVAAPLLPGVPEGIDSLSDEDMEPTVEPLPPEGIPALTAGFVQPPTPAEYDAQDVTVLVEREGEGTLSPFDSFEHEEEVRTGSSFDWLVWIGFFGMLSMVALAAIAVMVGAVVTSKYAPEEDVMQHVPSEASSGVADESDAPADVDRKPAPSASPAPVVPAPRAAPRRPAPTNTPAPVKSRQRRTEVRLQTFPYGSEIRVSGLGLVGNAPQIVEVPIKLVGAQVKDRDKWVSFTIDVEEGIGDYCLMVPTRQVHVGKCPVNPTP